MEQTNEMTYTQAVTELEQLVQKMQDPQCSIDNLSEYTRRSKQLLDICRKKLTAADEQLKQILADIQANNA
ncbi:MAG: exodeoxyribonuclease VII small subunit [Muribaculaceae bacterium]|jgi:exodeoxyribonuclease VII small subunit|nr:exodeoxyribonuclease VII small subunit [Muribaculaceae bacterium]